MSVQDILTACAAQGYRADPAAATASGVEGGIAFLARVEPGTLEMSVNIPADRLEKLRARVAAASPDFGGVTVAHHNFGVLLTLPGAADLAPDVFVGFIRTSAAEAAKLIGVAYDDKFEKDREPFSSYIGGFFGALLGALVGVVPWVLVTNLVHIQFGYLGFLISIASFYGYCYLRGAHSTSYAVTVIVIFSLGVMFLPDGIANVIFYMQAYPDWSLGQALSASFSPSALVNMLPGMGFGLVSNIIGLTAIRGRVLSYTHSSWYLRRSRKK